MKSCRLDKHLLYVIGPFFDTKIRSTWYRSMWSQTSCQNHNNKEHEIKKCRIVWENFLHIVTTMSGQNTAQHGRNVSSEALAENSDTSSDDNDRNWSFPSITSW